MTRLLLTIHFVRHGETTANRDGIIQGQQDYDLTPLGVNQAAATAARLRNNSYWQTHSSDLKRASRTAEIILEERTEAIIKKTPLLREFSLGVQEDLPRGTSWSEACRIKAEEAGVPLEDYDEEPREMPSDVHKRAQQFLDDLVADARRAADEQREKEVLGERGTNEEKQNTAGDEAQGNDVAARLALVVSHGGLLNVMMVASMDLGEVGFMTNCAVAEVDVFEEEDGMVWFVPQNLNDDSHVESHKLAGVTRVANFKRQ